MLSNTNFFSFFNKRKKIKLLYKSLSWFKEKKWKKQTEKPWKEIEKETKHFCQTWKKKLKNKTKQTDIEKKNYTQRKIFHNMLYEHKICMQNAAFLMCLIEACNTKKISVTPLFRYRGPFIYDVTRFSPRFLKPSHSPLRNCFQLFLNFWPLLLGPLGGPIKIVT